MSGAQSISTRRAYGVQRVCRVWHRARSSVYARRQATRSPAPCRRRGPIGAAPDDVLVAHIRRVLEAWRWCADAGRPTRFKPSSPSPTDAVRDGSAKLGHPVQNVTREHGLTPLPR